MATGHNWLITLLAMKKTKVIFLNDSNKNKDYYTNKDLPYGKPTFLLIEG